MPYVNSQSRDKIDPWMQELLSRISDEGVSTGELNYIVTRVVTAWLPAIASYDQIADVVKTMEMAKLELYRRVAAPYEDYKAAENEDVY